MTFSDFCNNTTCKNCKYLEYYDHDSWDDCETHWQIDHDAAVRIKTIDEMFLAIDQEMPYDICDGREAMNEISLIVDKLKEIEEDI